MRSKLENFWYYYKYHTIAGIFVLILLYLIISSCIRSDETYEMVLVDSTARFYGNNAKQVMAGFEEHMDWDEGSTSLRYNSNFVDERTAEQTGAKSLERAVRDGDVDCLFSFSAEEAPYELVGDIESALSAELLDELKDYLKSYIIYDANGDIVDNQPIAGIVINDAKRCSEFFGELDEYVIIQVPGNGKNKENVEAFIRYLFEI